MNECEECRKWNLIAKENNLPYTLCANCFDENFVVVLKKEIDLTIKTI